MNKSSLSVIILLLFGFGITQINAQTTSASNNLVAQPIPDRTVTFDYSGTGVSKPMIWGMDAGGWTSPVIWTTGINYLDAENIKITRIPAFPTDILYGDTLQVNQKNLIKDRLNQAGLVGHPLQIMLNHGGGEISWYSRDAVGQARYALLMELTKKYLESFGHTVVSITGFNEPDYGWDGATMDDFKNFIAACKSRPGLSGVRFCGGNTLNDDLALSWYNYVKPAGLNEGNTHQLAGSFDSYASFYQTVKANGHYATNDEVHNIMESIVGAEYGLQTGIYWGYASLARGEFVKACNGVRLGYAEHRPNWTAAAVYRKTDGQVEAFGGTSERQAATTTYRFVSKDRDVYFEGYGPQREYTMVMPGGAVGSYQNGQTNAERVVNITSGDDIQQPISGRYVLVNRNSGKVMEVTDGSTTAGAYIRQNNNAGANATYQQWDVTPLDSRIGGDFSYFTFTNVKSAKVTDLVNYSLDNGGKIVQWDNLNTGNQQWYFNYIGDGWFYIRNRHSSKCLEVANNSTSAGASVQQWDKDGGTNQQWRFLPVGTTVDFVSPSAPSNLVATANTATIRLDWTANPEMDVAGYTIFRSDSAAGPYNTIARNVTTNQYVDNTSQAGELYFYKIKAIDKSLNSSPFSSERSATATGMNDLVARFNFEENTLDSTSNLYHCAPYGGVTYTVGKIGSKAISLNGSTGFLQLPVYIANHQEMTVATWVYWNGTTNGQRIFDFGNNSTEFMYLTPKVTVGGARFAIKYAGTEQQLNATALPTGKWSHVAVTLGSTGATMYVNGVQVSTSSSVTLSPLDFKPMLNYIGRSQTTTPLFNGMIDDFRIYNYALSANEVAELAGILSGVPDTKTDKGLTLWPVPANDKVQVYYLNGSNAEPSVISVFNMKGQQVLSKEIIQESDLDVSCLPSDIYVLKLTNRKETLVKKLTVKH